MESIKIIILYYIITNLIGNRNIPLIIYTVHKFKAPGRYINTVYMPLPATPKGVYIFHDSQKTN